MADRYYWLKLQRDFFKRHDVQIVEAMTNGKDYVLFYLKLLCESIDHEGRLRFSESIPYNDEMLATITNTNIDTVRSAVKIFTELGLMELLDDGTFFMSEVHKMIGSASNNPNAIRQQRFRDNKKNQLKLTYTKETVTENNAPVTDCVTKSKSKSKSKSENIYISSLDEEEPEVPTENMLTQDSHTIATFFMDKFNEIPGVVPCSRLHTTREISISTIASKYSAAEILEAFDNLAKSDFLTGKVPGTNGKIFRATFDWFINLENFTKVYEGAYTNLKAPAKTSFADGGDPNKYKSMKSFEQLMREEKEARNGN